MQPMSSMQTTLLPGVTPGWNDPPPIGNPSSGSRLNRYRRVVDPSLTAVGGSPTPYTASPSNGMPIGAPHGMPMQPVQPLQQPMMRMQQPMQQLQHHQQQPQQPMQQPQQYMQQMPQQQYTQHGYSMPPPAPPPTATPQQQQLQHGGQGDGTTASPPPPIPVLQQTQQVVPPALPVAGVGVTPMPPYGDQAIPLPNPSQWDNNPNVGYTDQAKQPGQMAAFNASAFSTRPSAHSSPTQYAPSAHQLDPSTYVFNHPPNAVVPVEEEGKLMQYVDMSTYRPPLKAPGDVSLPPAKLHEFLVKAGTTLHNSKSQGVQLRLRDLPDELRSMSADLPFVKKFNYVIDYIDRSLLDDAQSQLDQLVASFPMETKQATNDGWAEKKWVGGIRFLIQELRRHPHPH